MRIVVVEDEPIILRGEMDIVRRCAPDADVMGFDSAEEALAFLQEQPVDVVFLDIEMPEMSGVDLARKIKVSQPHTNIIFATAYDQFYQEAFRLRASGYILKPMREADVRTELEELRYPFTEVRRNFFVRTFGDFEVFYLGEPVMFRYQKTKELFAYLIDRNGSMVSSQELISVLWEGKLGKENYFKQLRKDLKDTFEAIGYTNILVKKRGLVGVLPERISCDYYQWLQGKPEGINAYQGEYMSQYSWAEVTRGGMEEKLRKMKS